MSYYDAAYSTRETVNNTRHYTQDVLNRRVPGALVECGVAGGAQLGAMHSMAKTERWIYGFDSFEGIPIASKDDDVQPGVGINPGVPYNNVNELLRTSGITVHSKESVRRNLDRWTNNQSHNVVLVKGWFQNTLANYHSVFRQLGGIALLRLDGDLYESTKVCLQQLFPLLSDGGILIVDDWKLLGCKKACQEYFAHFSVCQLRPPYGTEEDGPAYFIKRSVPALAYRANTFSQGGEDGILTELLRRLPSKSNWVCEFGAWDGKQYSNTFKFVEMGFDAVYIEGREDYFELLKKTCEDYPNIVPVHKMVAYEGEDILDNILFQTPIAEDFDILSIDIDSFDYQVWKSLEIYQPKIVVIEINSSICPLDVTHIHGGEKVGTGFLPMAQLAKEKGYVLICHTGNLIFVRNDLASYYTDLIIPEEHCYRSSWFF